MIFLPVSVFFDLVKSTQRLWAVPSLAELSRLDRPIRLGSILEDVALRRRIIRSRYLLSSLSSDESFSSISIVLSVSSSVDRESSLRRDRSISLW